ncbi:hypothetical protein KA078_03825 [Candidatus Woesebacteria bacterium]|nr:hypothetical protein [Candidatus Woesebacteria bacterium]
MKRTTGWRYRLEPGTDQLHSRYWQKTEPVAPVVPASQETTAQTALYPSIFAWAVLQGMINQEKQI